MQERFVWILVFAVALFASIAILGALFGDAMKTMQTRDFSEWLHSRFFFIIIFGSILTGVAWLLGYISVLARQLELGSVLVLLIVLAALPPLGVCYVIAALVSRWWYKRRP